MNSLMADLRADALEVSRSLRCLTYRIDATCIHCGHHLIHRATGTTTGRAARALADCPNCGHVHMIETTVTTIPGRPIKPAVRHRPVPRRTDAQIEHGTERGYQQHRHVSPACDDCKDAHARHERDRTARSNP